MRGVQEVTLLSDLQKLIIEGSPCLALSGTQHLQSLKVLQLADVTITDHSSAIVNMLKLLPQLKTLQLHKAALACIQFGTQWLAMYLII